MGNAMFDFGDDDGISGFVGGGAGIARVKANNYRVFANQGAFLDDSDSRFAWQAIAGVRQAITDNLDVTLKYRFFNVDDVKMVAFNGAETELPLPFAQPSRRPDLQLRWCCGSSAAAASASAPAAPTAAASAAAGVHAGWSVHRVLRLG